MSKYFNIIASVIIVILLLLLSKSCNKVNNYESLSAALNDTLSKTRNSFGQEVTTRQVIEAENKKQFLSIKSKDSTIIALQKVVKETKGLLSATILRSQTSNTVSGTTSVSGRDTVFSGDTIKIYPEYAFTRENKWENISIKANKDSTHIDYKIFNDFNITQSMKKQGLFKAPVAEIQIVNLNPRTETLDVRSFQVKSPDHRMRYLVAGTVIGAISTFLLLR